MAAREGVMTRKVRETNAREYRRVAIVERFSDREHAPKPIKHREADMPSAVLARQYYYLQLKQAKAAVARGGW
jgi:hypothetical protein